MVQDNASRSANEDPQLAALRKLYNSQVDPVKKLEIQEWGLGDGRWREAFTSDRKVYIFDECFRDSHF